MGVGGTAAVVGLIALTLIAIASNAASPASPGNIAIVGGSSMAAMGVGGILFMIGVMMRHTSD
ncbi:MAG: hypothetical protein K940chlam9_01357 [Chlamydiae bacterium]|nr:hypothetical protein [Chlamydiota bacterium]